MMHRYSTIKTETHLITFLLLFLGQLINISSIQCHEYGNVHVLLTIVEVTFHFLKEFNLLSESYFLD